MRLPVVLLLVGVAALALLAAPASAAETEAHGEFDWDKIESFAKNHPRKALTEAVHDAPQLLKSVSRASLEAYGPIVEDRMQELAHSEAAAGHVGNANKALHLENEVAAQIETEKLARAKKMLARAKSEAKAAHEAEAEAAGSVDQVAAAVSSFRKRTRRSRGEDKGTAKDWRNPEPGTSSARAIRQRAMDPRGHPEAEVGSVYGRLRVHRRNDAPGIPEMRIKNPRGMRGDKLPSGRPRNPRNPNDMTDALPPNRNVVSSDPYNVGARTQQLDIKEASSLNLCHPSLHRDCPINPGPMDPERGQGPNAVLQRQFYPDVPYRLRHTAVHFPAGAPDPVPGGEDPYADVESEFGPAAFNRANEDAVKFAHEKGQTVLDSALAQQNSTRGELASDDPFEGQTPPVQRNDTSDQPWGTYGPIEGTGENSTWENVTVGPGSSAGPPTVEPEPLTQDDMLAPANAPFDTNELLKHQKSKYVPEPGVQGLSLREHASHVQRLNELMQGLLNPPPTNTNVNETSKFFLPPPQGVAPFLRPIKYPGAVGSAYEWTKTQDEPVAPVPQDLKHEEIKTWEPFHDVNPGSPPDLTRPEELGAATQESSYNPTLARNMNPTPEPVMTPNPGMPALVEDPAKRHALDPGAAQRPWYPGAAVKEYAGMDQDKNPSEYIAQGPNSPARKLAQNLPSISYVPPATPEPWPQNDPFNPQD